ncbi:MAG: class I SAM-dependent methyltransferase [Anaerolineales bacterium]|nr:class I SAM-dependent methyltransferase [Anaerolineales bacterium]
MTKPRIPETDQGIQGEITVAQYDEMLRTLRDRGWIETKSIINNGIKSGHALEIGYGPGYLGLEWLKFTQSTTLTGLDISPDMQKMARKNAETYGVNGRAQYQLGNCDNLPFEDNTFDAVFTNGSLHEWEHPCDAFDEIWRVLKPGGRFFISDMRRDMNFIMQWFLWLGTKPSAIRPGLKTSIGAAYTPQELTTMVKTTKLRGAKISANLIGLEITGSK